MSRPQTSPSSTTLTVKPRTSRPPGAVPHAYLLVIADRASSLFHLPPAGEVVLGRAKEADLCILDPGASRKHAKLSIKDGTVQIMDLHSHNGTRVNGERITAACTLSSGDAIAICETLLVLHQDPAAAGPRPLVDLAGVRRRIDEEVERALAFQRHLGLLCVSFGAAVADYAPIAEALAEKVRLIDVIGWGGATQLLVLLPEIEEEDALETAAVLLQVLAPLLPTVRIGVAVCPGDGAAADTLLASARCAAVAAQPGQALPAADAITRLLIGERSIVVADTAMVRLYQMIERLAQSELPVLIYGETGAGKEIAASAIHCWSGRKGRLVTLNCAALPEALVESELFGYEKGAFSGAAGSKVGLLESASGGTVFLDEVGELPLAVQAKLLRVLEARRLTRLGDVRERAIDIRVVAATNRKLEQEVEAGRFRQDLLFRLSAALVVLPPLRDRPRELPLLIRALLDEACTRAAREPLLLSEPAMQRLLNHRWPGNVRELKNVTELLVAMVQGPVVEPSHLPESVTGPATSPPPTAARGDAPEVSAGGKRWRALDEEVRELERARMAEALSTCGGNQTRAAELISVPLRTFAGKVKQYNLLPGGSPLRRR